jgi:hypothetical protein
LGSITDLVGFLASGMTVAASSGLQMPTLRRLAIAANLSFIACGSMLGLAPILKSHGLLPPDLIGLGGSRREAVNRFRRRRRRHRAAKRSPGRRRSAIGGPASPPWQPRGHVIHTARRGRLG